MASRIPSFDDDVAARAAESHVPPIQNRDGDAASLSLDGARTSDARDAIATRSARKPLVIGIAGGSGSGKSTVARRVGEAISGKGGMEAANLKVAQEYVAAFGDLAKTSNTMIVPANAADIASMVTTAMTVLDRTKQAQAKG